MIEGLKVTLTGEELRRRLDERIAERRAAAGHWDRERVRTAADATEDSPLLPDHISENEADRQRWRAEVLTFVRDHLDPSEVYRLDESDLEFAELLPGRPGWMEQEDLGPFAKRICACPEIVEIVNPDR